MNGISAADLTALYTGYKGTMERAFGDYKPEFEGFYTFESSSSEREAYPISAINSIMTRFAGENEYKDLMTKVKYVDNGDQWHVAAKFRRKDIILRSRGNLLETTALQHGKGAASLPDRLIVSALQSGASRTWVDGVNFFALTGSPHPVNPWDSSLGTWFNRRTSFALSHTNFETVLQEMMTRTGWDGQPMNLSGFELVVPPQLRGTAKRILESEYVVGPETNATGGNTNINKGAATLRISQLLSTEPAVWYLAAVGDYVKPYALQEWLPLEVIRMFDMNSSNVFELDEYRMKTQRGLEYAELLPHLIYRCEG